MSRLGVFSESVTKAVNNVRIRTNNYLTTKRHNFVTHPLVSTVNDKARYLVSYENIENVKDRYNDAYHWLAGTEVTQVQDRVRYLESKLNHNRKEMRDTRELLTEVIERLRNIASELERTGRGDVKAMHLRQQEYDSIQEEIKLNKIVQKAEFQERETFTLLMNAVREAHETERNYNQRIKMVSLMGAIVGPFLGYLFSARLNAMRFRKMEQIINRKLEILSATTIATIKEVHGLDSGIVSEPEKLGLIQRVLELFRQTYIMIINSYEQLFDSLKKNILEMEDTTQPKTVTYSTTVEVEDKGTQVPLVDKPEDTKHLCETTETVPPTPIAAPQPSPQVMIPNFLESEEFLSVVESLSNIITNQEYIKKLLASSLDLQESNKIDISLNSSDDEIIKLLQSDQETVRKILKSIEQSISGNQSTMSQTLGTLQENVDHLSKKIINNSEIFVGSLEHSKVMNDVLSALDDINTSINTMETIYSNDVSLQFEELSKIHTDLSFQISDAKANIVQNAENLSTIEEKLSNSDSQYHSLNSKIEETFDNLSLLISEVKSEVKSEVVTSATAVFEKLDEVIQSIGDIKTITKDLHASSNILNEDKISKLQNKISENIDSVMEKIENSLQNCTNLVNTSISDDTVSLRDTMQNSTDSINSNIDDKISSLRYTVQDSASSLNSIMKDNTVSIQDTIQSEINICTSQLTDNIVQQSHYLTNALDNQPVTKQTLDHIPEAEHFKIPPQTVETLTEDLSCNNEDDKYSTSLAYSVAVVVSTLALIFLK